MKTVWNNLGECVVISPSTRLRNASGAVTLRCDPVRHFPSAKCVSSTTTGLPSEPTPTGTFHHRPFQASALVKRLNPCSARKSSTSIHSGTRSGNSSTDRAVMITRTFHTLAAIHRTVSASPGSVSAQYFQSSTNRVAPGSAPRSNHASRFCRRRSSPGSKLLATPATSPLPMR